MENWLLVMNLPKKYLSFQGKSEHNLVCVDDEGRSTSQAVHVLN